MNAKTLIQKSCHAHHRVSMTTLNSKKRPPDNNVRFSKPNIEQGLLLRKIFLYAVGRYDFLFERICSRFFGTQSSYHFCKILTR